MCLEPQIKAVAFIYIFKLPNLNIRKELIFEERKNGLEKGDSYPAECVDPSWDDSSVTI